MSFEIQGKLHKKFDTDQKTKTFQARDFVITVDSNGYENFIKFQLTQDRCDMIDSIPEGEEINVHFDLRGREWNDKYFTNLNAWKIESAKESTPEDKWPEPDSDIQFDNSGDGNSKSDSSMADNYEEDYPF